MWVALKVAALKKQPTEREELFQFHILRIRAEVKKIYVGDQACRSQNYTFMEYVLTYSLGLEK